MTNLPVFDFPTQDIQLTVCAKKDDTLAEIKKISPDPPTPEKIRTVYTDLYFPPAPEDRPYTYGSIVLSLDGKMAFSDKAQGPVIANANKLDKAGGQADFWILNALRTYADADIIGANTLMKEPEMTGHLFDADLASARIQELKKKNKAPINVVVSFDGTDIPLNHKTFHTPDLEVWIATSPKGAQYLDGKTPGAFTVINYTPGTSTAIDIKPGTIPVIVTGRDASPDSLHLLHYLKKAGIERLLVESPSYMWHLLSKAAFDEWFINYSALYAGGPIAPGIQQPFSWENHPHADILTLATHQCNFMYTRQKITYE